MHTSYVQRKSIGLPRQCVEKGTARSYASGFNRSRTLDGMDLMSLTFRTLDLTDTSQEHEKGEIRESEHRRIEENNKEKRRGRSKKEDDSTDALNIISLNEVAWHDTPDDCWMVIYDFVYDCTDFLSSHPGGEDVLLEYAGRDATLAFIGFGHPRTARQSLQRYLIGELPSEERIFRVPGGVKVIGF